MAADRVHGFILATETVRATGVDQMHVGHFDALQYVIGFDQMILRQRDENTRRRSRHDLGQHPAGCLPGLQSAVEQRHAVMTQPAQ